VALKSNNKTVCLLGGTGFVGRSLAARLEKRGYGVRIPTRSRQRNRKLLVLPSVDLIEADIHDPDQLSDVLSGCDVIINLVGILHEKGHQGLGFKRAHVDLPEKILSAALELGIPRLLHMSALKANAERGPSHYLRSKGQAEKLIAHGAGEDLHYTIFQPSVIFGPGDGFLNLFATMMRLTPVVPLARPNARFAPVYVEDVSQAFATAVENRATYGKTYQLCGPQIYSLREIIELLGQVMDVKRLIIGLPDSLSQLQAWVMDYLVPGKLFTLDNYRSLTVNSICTENGLAQLDISATPMELIVPEYLGTTSYQRWLSRLRASAGR
jgi:NADH dehydrogenase